MLQQALELAQFNQRKAAELLCLSYHQLRGLSTQVSTGGQRICPSHTLMQSTLCNAQLRWKHILRTFCPLKNPELAGILVR